MWPLLPPPRHRPHHIHMPQPPLVSKSVHCPVRIQRPQHQFIVNVEEETNSSRRRLHWLPWMSRRRWCRSTASQNHNVSSGARRCVASSSGASDVNSCGVDAKTCHVGNVHVAAGGGHSPSGCVASAPAVPMVRCCCVLHASLCLAASVGAHVATYATTTFTLATTKELTTTTELKEQQLRTLCSAHTQTVTLTPYTHTHTQFMYTNLRMLMRNLI